MRSITILDSNRKKNSDLAGIIEHSRFLVCWLKCIEEALIKGYYMLDIGGLLEKVSKVKLNGGFVGKTCMVIMVVSVCFASIGYSSNSDLLKASIAGLIFLFGTIFLWKLISFADRHPQAALLEGSEFIIHEQMRMGSKNSPIIEISPTDRSQSAPIIDEEAIALDARKPDYDVTPLINTPRKD